MPDAGPKSDIEQSVGNDPHVGTDHGFVEWVRVVKGQGSLLAVPLSSSLSSSFEAWRPIMESSCGNAIWEWTVHSGAWNEDWQQTTQWPYLFMADWLNDTGIPITFIFSWRYGFFFIFLLVFQRMNPHCHLHFRSSVDFMLLLTL